MLNYNFITQKAKESLIDEVTIEREYWQLLFLQRLYQFNSSQGVFFKGGTAIRFLLGSFRFSEDLDFTSTLSIKKVEELFAETYDFFKKNSSVELEFRKEKIAKRLEDVSLRFKFLFYPQGLETKTSIRLDISLRETPLFTEQSVLVPFDYPIAPYPLVTHLSSQEILAEKIRALLLRGSGRDLFDLWFLLSKKTQLDEKLVEKKFKSYPQLKFSQDKLREKVEAFEPHELKKDLNRFLPGNYRSFYQDLSKETLKLLTQISWTEKVRK